ncbi:metal ABC transporter solute-binding protein, Zn/Mn family [Roseivirga sp. BDSF3-8]|uniref:metal ABC transporter solute-binding protein, Zn/Mn family n=1 Tax=Roseivirga sp. BDSF3-8 TaxID=3241598 RepID=UPI0035324923
MQLKFFSGLILIAILLTACGDNENQQDGKPGKLKVVTTTGMIADVLREVAGDSATVTEIMGPGVDPHVYKASQGDLKKLTGADMIFYNGLHLEGKMGEVLEKLARQKPVFAVAESVDTSRLLHAPGYQDAFDPHIWFDVSLWQAAMENAVNFLVGQDTANAEYYRKNWEAYRARMEDVHEETRRKVRQIPSSQRVLITAHDAFHYFGNAYNIEVRGLQGISTLSEYGVRDVQNLAEFITENKIKAVFVETSVSEKAINAVVKGARERGHIVKIGGSLYSDAMGPDDTAAGTYLGMVRTNVNTIVNSLK